MRRSEEYMSEIVKEKPIMEEAHKRYNNFIRSRLMRRLSDCGVSEYDKKELYQYDKKIMLADERRIGRREGKLEGIREGKLEGIKDGIETGEKNKTISMAKNMKSKNIDINLISEITGLSIEEIRKLKTDE